MTFPFKLIDLTHTLEETIPTWNGGCGFNHDVHIDYSDYPGEYKFRVMKIKMHAGIGTHMDAPSHCIPEGKKVHEFDVNDLIMPCVVIDVSPKVHQRYTVTPQDIEEFESKHGLIPEGSCVLINTGWGEFWGEPSKYHNNHVFPSVSPEVAELLLERSVSALGIDTLSPDRPEDGFKVHQLILGAGKIIIENAANLKNMSPKGAFVMAFPLKIREGTEAPLRLVGLIEKE
jgi:kynurenine formamidase